MDINLRKAIIHNVKDNSHDELEATIVDAIENGEEKLLPGLGVLFELIWNESDANKRTDLVDTLEKGLERVN
ncbi:MAG TPA: small acid-soluble spore protein SspI [Pseudogracilibacillus sp.]|nr:small acid-soluble spore protein SspI [Pseudogracilibacillus sp.]